MTFSRLPFLGLLMATGLVASAWADSINIPDSDFNTIYKPGYTPGSTTVVSATALSGWANFEGTSSAKLSSWSDGYSTVTWSDGSTSSGATPDYVVLPGWTGTGAVQPTGPDGSISLAQNGSERMHSSASLGTIAANTNYLLSADARGISFSGNSATFNRLYLNLLADDEAVLATPAEIVTTGSYANYSVTFTAAQLLSFVGKSLKVELGGFATYDQVQIDNVALTTQSVPEPTTLISLASFACATGLFLGFRRWRQG